jgi:hypothetical protein
MIQNYDLIEHTNLFLPIYYGSFVISKHAMVNTRTSTVSEAHDSRLAFDMSHAPPRVSHSLSFTSPQNSELSHIL